MDQIGPSGLGSIEEMLKLKDFSSSFNLSNAKARLESDILYKSKKYFIENFD